VIVIAVSTALGSEPYNPNPTLRLAQKTRAAVLYGEEGPFSLTGPFSQSLDFSSSAETYYFNSAEQIVGVRGLFSEAQLPCAVLWENIPISPSICGAHSPAMIPVISRRHVARYFHPSLSIDQALAPAGVLSVDHSGLNVAGSEFLVTVGDEVGDALMLDFLDGNSQVANRGSLLGLEVGVGESINPTDSWWARTNYRKDDWLAYRRHSIRRSIAPLEEGRENVGTDERLCVGGGVNKSLGSTVLMVDAVGQAFPAIWLRDPGTRRTTKWEGSSGIAVIKLLNWKRRWPYTISIAMDATQASTVHMDSEYDARHLGRTETLQFRIRRLPFQEDWLSFGGLAYARVLHAEVSALGDNPSHGYDGPSRILTGGASLRLSHRFASGSLFAITTRLDKREHTPVLPSVVARFQSNQLWVQSGISGRLPDPFHEGGWSSVRHFTLGTEEIRFVGGSLEPERVESFETGLRWVQKHLTARVAFHWDRVRDQITAAVEEWATLGDEKERVRSGHWTNGGEATSVGVEISCGREGGWGGIWGFLFVRDVDWDSDVLDVSPPPLGGKAGGGVQTVFRLPKKTELLTRLRAVGEPRFDPSSSWTEETGSGRLRWDAAVTTSLSRRWHVVITAMDILDDGHVEIPGGNAVGFRAAGELRWRP
jgi:hypothetical protein